MAFPTMEVFSLLKYWTPGVASIPTASSSGDGPFFDLELTGEKPWKLFRNEENEMHSGRFPTKLRSLMLRLKRSKSESPATKSEQQQQHDHRKMNRKSTESVQKYLKMANRLVLIGVSKHLGMNLKSKSAVVPNNVVAKKKKRDDSVLEEEDGIQSAILHCKRSLNGDTVF